MLNNGFTEGQEKFLEFIEERDPNGMFLFAIRDKIEACAESYHAYNTAKKIIDDLAEKFKPACEKINEMFAFLSQLCEGHNLRAQDILREQPNASKTCNIFEESLDFVLMLGKNMVDVKKMGDFECELLESTMGFLVEVVQGPCRGNQDFVVRNAVKVLEVCKNILSCSFPEISDGSLKERLNFLATSFLCALLENRGDNLEVHKLLIQSLPYDLLIARLKEIAEMEEKLGYVKGGKLKGLPLPMSFVRIPKQEEDMNKEEKRLSRLKIKTIHYSKIDGYNWCNENIHGEWKAKASVPKAERAEAAKWREDLIEDFETR